MWVWSFGLLGPGGFKNHDPGVSRAGIADVVAELLEFGGHAAPPSGHTGITRYSRSGCADSPASLTCSASSRIGKSPASVHGHPVSGMGRHCAAYRVASVISRSAVLHSPSQSSQLLPPNR